MAATGSSPVGYLPSYRHRGHQIRSACSDQWLRCPLSYSACAVAVVVACPLVRLSLPARYRPCKERNSIVPSLSCSTVWRKYRRDTSPLEMRRYSNLWNTTWMKSELACSSGSAPRCSWWSQRTALWTRGSIWLAWVQLVRAHLPRAIADTQCPVFVWLRQINPLFIL